MFNGKDRVVWASLRKCSRAWRRGNVTSPVMLPLLPVMTAFAPSFFLINSGAKPAYKQTGIFREGISPGFGRTRSLAAAM